MASRSFRLFVEQELGRFPHLLIYAILEWLMIILLLLDGFLAFISNEFAHFFELRIPCLLCTRIDHILVRRDSDFYYNDSICETHKKDISSLAYCHVHSKLSDIRSMCEGCLLSFATEKESDRDTYKSLVGILHKDIDCFVEDDQRVFMKSGKKDDVVEIEKSSLYRCCCCGEPLKTRPKNYGRSSSMNKGGVRTPVYARSMSMNNKGVLSQVAVNSPRVPVGQSFELPHIRCTQLKFMSNNELEVPKEEDGPNADNQLKSKEDIKAAAIPLLADSEYISEDACKTPSFRGNKFFGISLTDSASASASPRFSSRFSRKILLEKPDFMTELNDTNAANEADGDSILHRLKRQVRLDRKSLIEMYMELDEERSASAVAANNAMAMITRIQAEKAAVQMEALQYQRMMEEQAEYDQEELQVMKDTLLKREDEIKVLEADLEAYRERYGHIKKVVSDECEEDADEDYQELKSHSFSSSSEKSDCGSPTGRDHNGENEGGSQRSGEKARVTIDEYSLDFERERSYLLSTLTDLEKKINLSSCEGVPSSESNMIKHEDEDRGHENKSTLTREVSLMRERLSTIEADSGFLKHAVMTLQKGGEGSKLVAEIAQHLQKLRCSEKTDTLYFSH